MEAVCRTEHFAELIGANPANRARLLAIDVERFIAVMEAMAAELQRGGGSPRHRHQPGRAALNDSAGLHHPRQ